LKPDPASGELKDWVEAENPLPPSGDADALTPVFSPHRGRGVFDWWIALANAPGQPLFMTFPFGIVTDFRPAYDKNDGVLRFALLDKYVNGGTKESRAAAIADTERIRRHRNIRHGARQPHLGGLDRRLATWSPIRPASTSTGCTRSSC
jgi:hypothetical protein